MKLNELTLARNSIGCAAHAEISFAEARKYARLAKSHLSTIESSISDAIDRALAGHPDAKALTDKLRAELLG